MEVFLCPGCGSRPLFYKGCKNCGSGRISSAKFIHHFTCACVGKVEEFGEKLTCPKCFMTNLIVGSDFEHLEGPFECKDCNWEDVNFEITGFCDKCECIFPMSYCNV